MTRTAVGWPGRTPGASVSHNPGRPAAFATRQAEPAPEWVVNMGDGLASGPRPRFFSASFLWSQTHSAGPLGTRGARLPTPNPSRDGVSRSWQLRACRGAGRTVCHTKAAMRPVRI
jgi:hypothetical protein